MTGTSQRWGKAGQRLSTADHTARLTEIRSATNRSRNARRADNAVAYGRWRAGLVSPARITLALDASELDGPEVDRAFGVEEPAVDQWEAGERYPTWEELCALSELTSCTPRWFTEPGDELMPISATTLWYHIGAAERELLAQEPDPVLRYPRAVLDARPDSPAEMP